jgi:hypothetical protein
MQYRQGRIRLHKLETGQSQTPFVGDRAKSGLCLGDSVESQYAHCIRLHAVETVKSQTLCFGNSTDSNFAHLGQQKVRLAESDKAESGSMH